MPHRWNKAAALRREQIEDGIDITFNRVFVPYFLKCVKKYKPNRLLEVGCGTGHLAKHLVKVVSHVEALEPSPGMHSVASDVLTGSMAILHHVSAEEFRPSRKFDIAVSHLCGHVVTDVDKFCRSCSDLIVDNGLFIFSLPHPCFWNDYKEFFPKSEYRYAKEQFAHVELKITKDPNRPIRGVPFHHRPIGRYLKALNNAGMALTHFDEIIPSKAIQILYGQEWRFPRYCVFHAKKTLN